MHTSKHFELPQLRLETTLTRPLLLSSFSQQEDAVPKRCKHCKKPVGKTVQDLGYCKKCIQKAAKA